MRRVTNRFLLFASPKGDGTSRTPVRSKMIWNKLEFKEKALRWIGPFGFQPMLSDRPLEYRRERPIKRTRNRHRCRKRQHPSQQEIPHGRYCKPEPFAAIVPATPLTKARASCYRQSVTCPRRRSWPSQSVRRRRLGHKSNASLPIFSPTVTTMRFQPIMVPRPERHGDRDFHPGRDELGRLSNAAL